MHVYHSIYDVSFTGRLGELVLSFYHVDPEKELGAPLLAEP